MVVITGNGLNIEEVYNVAYNNEIVTLSRECVENIKISFNNVENMMKSNKIMYGVNTGFGSLNNILIDNNDASKLSRNIILSHSIAIGNELSREIVRAGILIRINTLAKGQSGVQLQTVLTMIELLNKNVIPVIPKYGSLACSGDLCLLSHLGLLISNPIEEHDNYDNDAYYNGLRLKGKEAMKMADIPTVTLGPKEGLAITNGSSFTTALTCINWYNANKLSKIGTGALALSMEAMNGVMNAYNAKVHEARNQKGQLLIAEEIRKMLKESEYVDSTNKIQDCYSLRCAAQVQGCLVDILEFSKNILEKEINATTDNPIIFSETECISGGNFHGEPIAQISDFLKIAIAEIAAISERRQARIVDPTLNGGKLPAMLTRNAGLQSGYMILQYTSASLCLNIQKLANPDSTISLPTCMNQEDHNSNGWNSALNCNKLIELTYSVITNEYVMSTRAINLLQEDEYKNKRLGEWTGKAYNLLNQNLIQTDLEHVLNTEVNNTLLLIKSNEFINLINNNNNNVSNRINLSIPKGTRDFTPEQMYIRKKIFKMITDVFENHGAVSIDTPTYEKRDILFGKYGENQKLVFDLDDQEGVLCSLRYDLTVPFARYMAMYGKTNMKRYHIAKVFRRDPPSIKQGRYREFFQCDFDIAGTYKHMVSDAECIKVISDILNKFDIKYTIKFNHKGLLDLLLGYCDVPSDKIISVCSSIDKMDKHTWTYIEEELRNKELSEETIQKISKFVTLKMVSESVGQHCQNQYEMLNMIYELYKTEEVLNIINDLKMMFGYLENFECLDKITVDFSLARGLSYYTGIIFEAILLDNEIGVGSIAAGGRYDNLIGMFCVDKQIPSVGGSIGIERLFAIMEARTTEDYQKTNDLHTIIILLESKTDEKMNNELYNVGLKIMNKYWKNGISCEISQKTNLPLKDQLTNAIKRDPKNVMIIGETELRRETVLIKNVKNKTQSEQRICEILNN